jgi:hypothetical protein
MRQRFLIIAHAADELLGEVPKLEVHGVSTRAVLSLKGFLDLANGPPEVEADLGKPHFDLGMGGVELNEIAIHFMLREIMFKFEFNKSFKGMLDSFF